jgi:hypothetical protein
MHQCHHRCLALISSGSNNDMFNRTQLHEGLSCGSIAYDHDQNAAQHPEGRMPIFTIKTRNQQPDSVHRIYISMEVHDIDVHIRAEYVQRRFVPVATTSGIVVHCPRCYEKR